MLSIIGLRKKIGIGKNRYRQVTLPKNRKYESAKKITISKKKDYISMLLNLLANFCDGNSEAGGKPISMLLEVNANILRGTQYFCKKTQNQ